MSPSHTLIHAPLTDVGNRPTPGEGEGADQETYYSSYYAPCVYNNFPGLARPRCVMCGRSMKIEKNPDGRFEYRAVDDDGNQIAAADDKAGLKYALLARGEGL